MKDFDFSKVTITNEYYETMNGCVIFDISGVDFFQLACRSKNIDELADCGLTIKSEEDLQKAGVEVMAQIIYESESREFAFVAFTDNEFNKCIIYDVELTEAEKTSFTALCESDKILIPLSAYIDLDSDNELSETNDTIQQ